MNNPIDSEHINPLSVACILLVALSPFLFENNYLFRLGMLLNGSKNTGVSNAWPSNRCVIWSTYHKYVFKANLLPDFKRNLLYHYPVVNNDLVLLAEKAKHCKHLFRMGWERQAYLLIVYIQDGILSFDWSPLCVSQLLRFSFESFLLKRYFPGIASFCVFFVLQEFVEDFGTILLIEVSEKLAESLSLEMTNYRQPRLRHQQRSCTQ